jgi:ribosomal protein S18 acetylase RimI-like enzyme
MTAHSATRPRPPRPRTGPPAPDGAAAVEVRRARLRDLPELLALSRSIYGHRGSWKAPELRMHQDVFPRGQFVAEDPASGRILGMAVSLIVAADRWPLEVSWRVVTDRGRLGTHDPSGETLYAAGVAVDPKARGLGVGSALYRAREALLLEMGLQRIRAGARIPGYGAVAGTMSAEQYVEEVVRGLRTDPTLSFQLAQGFQLLGVAPGYLRTDRASLGYAAVVEWRPES